MKFWYPIVAVATLAAGCAAEGDNASATATAPARAKPEFRTGSNMPVREPGQGTTRLETYVPASAPDSGKK